MIGADLTLPRRRVICCLASWECVITGRKKAKRRKVGKENLGGWYRKRRFPRLPFGLSRASGREGREVRERETHAWRNEGSPREDGALSPEWGEKVPEGLKPSIYIHSIPILSEIFSAGKPAGKEWNGERSSMAQHAILRFEKHKGHPAGPLEAHHERKKEQYASNPDIDTSRSKYNFHIVKPDGRYYHFIQSRIEQARCRTRKDSTRFVDTLITASPEFFKGKSPKEIAAYSRGRRLPIDRVGREKGRGAVRQRNIGNRANLTKWQDDFSLYGGADPTWSVGKGQRERQKEEKRKKRVISDTKRKRNVLSERKRREWTGGQGKGKKTAFWTLPT